MDEREFLIEELADGHRMVGSALSDLTEEVANWQAGGTANSIAGLLAHAIVVEDMIVNRLFGGGRSLFETGEWAEKTGIPAKPREIWQLGWTLNVAAFDQYRQEVQAGMDALMAGLDPASLDQEMDAFGGTRRGGDLLRISGSNHILGHLGEISVLRGMKGLAGLPI